MFQKTFHELWSKIFVSESLILLLLCSSILLYMCPWHFTPLIDKMNMNAEMHHKPSQSSPEIDDKPVTPVESLGKKPLNKKQKRRSAKIMKAASGITSTPAMTTELPTSSISDCLFNINQKLGKLYSCKRLNELAEITQRRSLVPLDIIVKSSTKAKKLPLLSAIKPENDKSEKERFMRANFNYNPYFLYSGQVDDEVMQKYRAPSNKYIPQAILIMNKTLDDFGSYEAYEEISGGSVLTRPQIYSMAKRYLTCEKLEKEVLINLSDDLLSHGSLTCKGGRSVLNMRCINLREHWAEGLLRHEVGTHYLRSCNTRCQPWQDSSVRNEMNIGPVNPTEEGLASLHSVLFSEKPYLWRAALLYYTTYMASKKSFKELFSNLGKFVKSPLVRWDYCLRAKRGQSDTSRPGSFCKDQVYLEGVLQLLKRRRSMDFQQLFRLGKVSFEDVNRTNVLKKAKLEQTRLPLFMENMDVYLKQLDYIAFINGLTDNVLRNVD